MLINKHNLKVAEFASKEESRYMLKAIQISEDGTTATNGHYMVNVSLPKAEAKNFPQIEGFEPLAQAESMLLDRDTALKIEKAMPKNENIPVLNHANVGKPGETTLNLAVTDLDSTQIFKPRKITGQFPNWKAVLPTGEPVVEIAFSADYLMQLARAAAAFTSLECNGGAMVRLRLYGSDKAALFETVNTDTEQKWTGVLMPVHLNSINAALARQAKTPEVREEETAVAS